MLAKLFSCAVLGLDGGLIEVEVDITQGLPAFTTFGYPDCPIPRPFGTSVRLLQRIRNGLLQRHHLALCPCRREARLA